jgi:flagellar assembly protein FliH
MAAMNSSKSSDFSPSELEALSVWQLPDLAGKDRRPNKADNQHNKPRQTAHLTVTEIEAMQKQAYDEAFAQGKADGFQQGYNAGYQEGAKKGHEENVQLLNQKAKELNRLMEALSEPFKTLDEEVEKELVKLSMGLASQIIRRELKTDPGEVIAAVREAIAVLPLSSQKVSLYLHPEDSGLVRKVLKLDDMSPAWTIVDDPLLTRGGCKIDTDVSHVDATVENRLAAAIASVFGGERARDRRS